MRLRFHSVRGKTDTRTMNRVTQAFAPYKFQVLLVLLLILISTGLDTINLLMIQRIFDDGIVKRNLTWLLIDVGIMVVIPIVSGISEVWQIYLNNIIGQNVMRNLRS